MVERPEAAEVSATVCLGRSLLAPIEAASHEPLSIDTHQRREEDEEPVVVMAFVSAITEGRQLAPFDDHMTKLVYEPRSCNAVSINRGTMIRFEQPWQLHTSVEIRTKK